MRTAYRDRAQGSGTHEWTWNGRNGAGDYVARGSYTLRLTVTSAIGTTAVKQKVLVALACYGGAAALAAIAFYVLGTV